MNDDKIDSNNIIMNQWYWDLSLTGDNIMCWEWVGLWIVGLSIYGSLLIAVVLFQGSHLRSFHMPIIIQLCT